MRSLLTFVLLSAAAFGVNVPRPAGDLTIKTPTGPQMLSMYRGKVVVVNFIHTNCRACQEVTRVLSGVYKDYMPKGVIILGAAFDPDSALNINEFIRTYTPSYPVGVIEPDKVISFTQVTEAMRPTTPMLIFVDRNGQFRAMYFGADPIMSQGDRAKNIRAEIDKYLK